MQQDGRISEQPILPFLFVDYQEFILHPDCPQNGVFAPRLSTNRDFAPLKLSIFMGTF